MKVGILLFLAFFLCQIKGNAQNFVNGCFVTTTNPDRIYLSNTAYYLVVCNGTDPDNEYAFRSGQLGAACNRGGYSGRLTNYTVAQCPIDDYIPFLILAIGSMGYFFINRKSSF